jgi:hypothetical protein
MSSKRVKLVLVAVFGLWLATPIVLKLAYCSIEARGQFGDMFGAVNALFTGAALIGAVYAISLQTKELELQREEFRRGTEEFRAQNEIMREQLEAARSAQRAAEARERLASMPFFRYRDNAKDLAGQKLNFENVGSDVYDLEVTTSDNATYRGLSRSDMWRKDEGASLYFAPAGEERLDAVEWWFIINFTTKIGTRESVKFVVRRGIPHKV